MATKLLIIGASALAIVYIIGAPDPDANPTIIKKIQPPPPIGVWVDRNNIEHFGEKPQRVDWMKAAIKLG